MFFFLLSLLFLPFLCLPRADQVDDLVDTRLRAELKIKSAGGLEVKPKARGEGGCGGGTEMRSAESVGQQPLGGGLICGGCLPVSRNRLRWLPGGCHVEEADRCDVRRARAVDGGVGWVTFNGVGTPE